MEKPKPMLDESLKFLKLLRGLELIERATCRPSGRKENDVEHSYQVAMISWFLANRFDLSLSLEKILKYSLVHDLIEVYAGDTPAFKKNQTDNTSITKNERERNAFIRIKHEFNNSDDFIKTIEDYENRNDEESIFVYEVDKIIPALNGYMDNGYSWNKLSLSLDEIKENKRSKVKHHKQLVDLLEEALTRFEEEKEKLFIDEN